MKEYLTDFGRNASVVSATNSSGLFEGGACFPSCEYQDEAVQLSSSGVFQSANFVLQLEFCKLAKRLLLGPCAATKSRRILVERQAPGLCDLLEERRALLTECNGWPRKYLYREDKTVRTIGVQYALKVHKSCYIFPKWNLAFGQEHNQIS